ncbi:MAG: hypothetical protein HY840_11205 [Bacteroidetes bacterium]|nr:hypothetical protein [Bacteroidota bacterium]
MARRNFPESFSEQKELLRLVKTKHDADGAGSVLSALLVQKNINLNDDTTASNTAATHDANQKQFMRDAEEQVQLRDLKFEPVFSNTRAEVQFLKSFYAPNVQLLGDWGVTVDNQNRINYPPDFISRAALVKDIAATHNNYAAIADMLAEDEEEMLYEDSETMLYESATATSIRPLNAYLTEHSVDINADAIAVAEAETAHANHLAMSRNAEEATQLRDNLWEPVLDHLHAITDYLMKLYKGSEKKLGEWGITVDDSPQAPTERISTVLPAEQITISSIIIGSVLTNIGTVAVHVYKGETATGTPAIVQPSEILGMIKGYSTITVVNPSTTVTCKFRVLRNR